MRTLNELTEAPTKRASAIAAPVMGDLGVALGARAALPQA